MVVMRLGLFDDLFGNRSYSYRCGLVVHLDGVSAFYTKAIDQSLLYNEGHASHCMLPEIQDLPSCDALRVGCSAEACEWTECTLPCLRGTSGLGDVGTGGGELGCSLATEP